MPACVANVAGLFSGKGDQMVWPFGENTVAGRIRERFCWHLQSRFHGQHHASGRHAIQSVQSFQSDAGCCQFAVVALALPGAWGCGNVYIAVQGE